VAGGAVNSTRRENNTVRRLPELPMPLEKVIERREGLDLATTSLRGLSSWLECFPVPADF